MQEVCGNIKTILQDMQGKGLSSTTNLVAILESCGVMDRAELEALIECKSSTLREARSSLKRQKSSARIPAVGDASARNPALAPEIQRQKSSDRQNSSVGTDHAIAHATKELPTEVVIPSKLDSPLAPHSAEMPASATGETAPTAPRRKPSSSPRGQRLDRAWQLPADWRMWARTNFPASTDALVDDQAAQFHDYWISKPGAQACKLDWEATWRNWCRKGMSQLGTVRRPQSTGVWPDGRKRLDLSKIKTYDYDPALEVAS